MKKAFLLFMILLAMSGYSQNRYSNYSVATYSPTILSPDMYQAIAEQKRQSLIQNVDYYDNLTVEALNSNSDDEFRQDIYEIRSYLNALKNDGSINISQAESYINIIGRKYNKAIRKYNRRLKKAAK